MASLWGLDDIRREGPITVPSGNQTASGKGGSLTAELDFGLYSALRCCYSVQQTFTQYLQHTQITAEGGNLKSSFPVFGNIIVTYFSLREGGS